MINPTFLVWYRNEPRTTLTDIIGLDKLLCCLQLSSSHRFWENKSGGRYAYHIGSEELQLLGPGMRSTLWLALSTGRNYTYRLYRGDGGRW